MPLPGGRRALLAALALVALVVVAACGGDDSPTVDTGGSPTTTAAAGPAPGGPAPASATVLSVTYRNGTVEGASRQRAPLGQPVIVRVTSDVAEEVHVHGYDETAPVAAGSTVDIRFDADIPGVFEVELERSHKLLFTLEVR